MLILSFTEEDLKTLYRLAAVIVLLCDLEFQLVKDNAGNNKPNVTNEILFVTNHEVLVKIADLLCVSPDGLITILITTSTGHHIYPRSLPDAIENRDNIDKNLHARLFGWVVTSWNDRISPEGSSSKNPVVFSIGVLDMFGFENFKKSNSLDQLLVNKANEELHSAFTRNLIQYNQQNHKQEGLYSLVFLFIILKLCKKKIDLKQVNIFF